MHNEHSTHTILNHLGLFIFTIYTALHKCTIAAFYIMRPFRSAERTTRSTIWSLDNNVSVCCVCVCLVLLANPCRPTQPTEESIRKHTAHTTAIKREKVGCTFTYENKSYGWMINSFFRTLL